MIPKQSEMDGIVERLYRAIESRDHLGSTLLVLCGDHGMNDAGNHGASSPGETSPALVFMSPRLKGIAKPAPAPAKAQDTFEYYSTVEQSDTAPTLAVLLGFPIPKNNLGAVIPDFLPFWPSPRDKVQILIRNARQILGIVTATFGDQLFTSTPGSIDPCALGATEINELACEWQKVNREASFAANASTLDQVWLVAISKWLRKAQNLMSSMASNYDMSRLLIGQVLAVVATFTGIAVVCLYGSPPSEATTPLALITVSYGAMMFASSYVEEEQHFWYWSSTLWLACLGCRAIQRWVSSLDATR